MEYLIQIKIHSIESTKPIRLICVETGNKNINAESKLTSKLNKILNHDYQILEVKSKKLVSFQ